MKQLKLHKTVRRMLYLSAALLLAVLLALLSSGQADETVSDRQERLDYLAALGWQADGESEQRQEIILPKQFEGIMADYAALQNQQGFALEDYAGKEVSLFSYRVTNWPEDTLTVIADLYVYKSRVIAGDIHATALDGFMIGLK